MTAEELLRKLVQVTPWENGGYESEPERCQWCGCDQHEGQYPDRRFGHWDTCDWVQALILVDIPLPAHQYIHTPKPPYICPDCGWVWHRDDNRQPFDSVGYHTHQRHQTRPNRTSET